MDKDWGWVFRGVDPSKPVPLEKVTKLLIPPSNLSYYWGYLEDTAPSYYLVSIKKDLVTVNWYLLGCGVKRVFHWKNVGEIKEKNTISNVLADTRKQ